MRQGNKVTKGALGQSVHRSVATGMPGWRYGFVMVVAAAVVAALAWRLVDLHVVDQGFLNKQAEMRSVRVETIEAHRGMIVDRHGAPLAVSTPVDTIWANPRELDAKDPQLSRLAAILGLDPGELKQRIRQYRGKEFMYISRKVQPALWKRVAALKIPGIYSRREFRRYYPAGEVAAQVVGFTNIDEQGQEGLELSYNNWLKGEPGSKRVLKDNRGHVIEDLSLIKDAVPGKKLQLSIDLRLQYFAYRELKAAVQEHDAKSGSLVMLDVHTGEVLAMVNQPSYNPNDRSQLKPSHLRNRAITDLFEPGSTVKPLSMSAALSTGEVRPGMTVDTTPGYMRIGRYTIRDDGNYGVLDLTHIIAKSSNVGMSHIALKVGGSVIRNTLSRFGLGQSTGIGFPGEAVGVLPVHVRWKPVEVATMSYGYGLSVSALQLAQAYMVLANGGVRYPVTLIKRRHQPEGVRVISTKVAGEVRKMLRAVVREGTGTRARMLLYQAAGKTGTVHIVGRNGYEMSAYKSIFAGMAPAEDPRIVCVVVIDAPKGNQYYGGEVAAPVFSRVMSESLRLLNVRPDLSRLASHHLIKAGPRG